MTTVSHYVVGVHWGPRKESSLEVATRVRALLRGLASCYPESRWCVTEVRGEKDLLAMDAEALASAIESIEPIARTDDSLGTLLTLWRGDRAVALGPGVHIHYGATDPYSVNSCRIFSPEPLAPALQHAATPATLVAMVRAMIVAWDPDWGWAARDSPLTALAEASTTDTHAGWLTYVTRRWGEVPTVPEAEHVEVIPDRGSLIVLTEKLLIHQTAESVDLALRVQRQLLEEGVLRRLTPEFSDPSQWVEDTSEEAECADAFRKGHIQGTTTRKASITAVRGVPSRKKPVKR